jgi:hypothetical protein
VRLLVAVLHREDLLDDVLSILVEFEEPDAVVVESRSGLELLEKDLPIFAGLRSLIPSGIDFSSLVVCLIEEDLRAGEALQAISRLGNATTEDVAGPRNTVMLIPVSAVEHF